ncbi:four-carbon acid sugar kinase family protein [Pseudarthrobacter sp. 1C304]|uniref:four-carbon acid sugar kinase family protein n=1 Tax=Pseudarthrobacter sp. 1C304 TaxID=3457438 RepID=UPI003FD3C67B
MLAGLSVGSAHNAQPQPVTTPVILDLHSADDVIVEGPSGSGQPATLVVDSTNRHVPGAEAAGRMRALLAARPQGSDVFLKFDSLLRGNLDAELAAALGTGAVAFCPALPELDRTVRNGVLEVHGIPLHRTDLWQAEPADPGHSVAALLAAARPAVVPLDTVRGGDLQQALASITSAGRLAVCDAETDADLDRIAAAALSRGIILAGASALAAAMRRSRPTPSDVPPAAALPVRNSPVLFILGTASPSARAQLTELELSGVPVHRVQHADVPSLDPGTEGSAAVVVDGPIDPSRSGAIVGSLAGFARRAHAGRHLVLSGGETARSVLDALGIRRMHPLAQAHPGAVVSVTADGRLVATRPGSFGDRHSLTQILTTMQALEAANPGKVSL